MKEIEQSLENLLSEINISEPQIKDKAWDLITSAYSKGYDDGCEWMKSIINKLVN